MDWSRLREAAWRHALAVCCVAAPLCFALVAPQAPLLLTAYKFNPPSAVPAPHYVFLPEERAEPDAAAVPPKHQSNGDGPAKVQTRDLSALVMARDISGRMRYGAVSALLYLIATAAFVYGAAGLVRRSGILALFVAILFLIPLSVALSGCAPTFEAIRPLVVELIFRDAEARKILPLSPFGETASMIALWVRVNTGAALLAIGMLLAALYSVSVRASDAELTFRGLAERRDNARWLLGFGSALLVIAVLASQILVEWPASLLVRSQQLALKPAGDAMTVLLGATGTIALLGAFAPAIAAITLDARRYYAATPVRAVRARDELGFATLSSVTGVAAVFAPLLVSLLKLLL